MKYTPISVPNTPVVSCAGV